MNHEIRMDVLAQLFERIERAWLDDGDRSIVFQLSAQYPEYREELYEFFEDLLLEPETESVPSELVNAENRVHEWLSSTGFTIAAQVPVESGHSLTTEGKPESRTGSADRAQPHGETWIMFLRRRTQERVPAIVEKLNNVTTEYLVLVSRHSNLLPSAAKTRLARDVERAWGIPWSDSLHCLGGQRAAIRAASRSRPFEREPQTFEELLDRSALSKDQRAFWLACAEE